MILKYGQGHWRWYEQIKLPKQNHHAKFDIHHFYGVWENCNVTVFIMSYNHPAGQQQANRTLIISQTHNFNVSKKNVIPVKT